MTTREDQLHAAALLWLLEGSEAGRRFMSRTELGRRYRAAQGFYGAYERRAIDWRFAGNLDRKSRSEVAVRRWWPDKGPAPTGILVLQGGKGCGKTTAAVGLLLRQGGEFIRAGVIHDIPLGDKGEETLARLRWAPLLVLDNLGSEHNIGPTLARISSLLIHRDGHQLPTVITTTLVPDYRDDKGRTIEGIPPERTIAGRYEDDIVDRINGDGEWEDVDEPSRRPRKVKPDLRAALESAGLFDLIGEVEKVKRGTGDPKSVSALADAARIPWTTVEAEAAKAQNSMREALSTIPDYLRDHPTFQRYAAHWGVAPREN